MWFGRDDDGFFCREKKKLSKKIPTETELLAINNTPSQTLVKQKKMKPIRKRTNFFEFLIPHFH
jgi:hypothetical protein